ncbi:MAG TPA: Gfo/Idh/MocA family oxidoreductase [Gammaproteobacteria bacterium]|nr:Gfo/Idh/MocA family oxidoreductase [Gammaproteobacteria bacterium]
MGRYRVNVAIIGCGLIGQKRSKALKDCQIIACVDSLQERSQTLANQFPGCVAFRNWQDAISLPDLHLVIVATLHESLAEIALAFIQAGKHVLVEKPAARSAKELEPLMLAAKQARVCVRVGFNHRYHRAFRKARQLVDEGALGELMFLRGRYGHGGRIAYHQEWRANPKLSGGGELIDQGVHLIDLARWFLGDFSNVYGRAHTYYWDMPVEDNGFMLLHTPKKQVAFLHASCTEWKNTFSFELFGKNGKIEINGLGGSYGTEKIAFYKMSAAMGPPETMVWEYPMADDSWEFEFAEFLEDIRQQRQPSVGINDAYAALKVVEKIYKDSGYDHCS